MTLLQYDPLVMAAFAMVIAAILAIGLRAEDEPPRPSVRQIQDRLARQGYRIASDRNPGAHRVSASVGSRHGLLRGRGTATMVSGGGRRGLASVEPRPYRASGR
ncbi:hypothetical protein APR12_003784 [Nocardia amikacinitolerans]|uniref:hypothetical protein n=1 Tax=Nocardia amikacinitolerans TaxID=756689 RepID=UPI00083399B1|nr:hypothetical protein [Nocardia amikacinitolerans]MCP2318429.1 hypothetical protein [Nocardia amikacinitolerans]